MAREAELICSIDNPTTPWVEDHDLTLQLKAFEALVRADEREARAKFFDLNDTNLFWGSQAAKHIRARGETK
jgi:hypothetical protein